VLARNERREIDMSLFSPPEVAVSGRVEFSLNGEDVRADATEGESLLTVLRERLGITSAKDGCAPQGQCGCCTVLVDGEPRVACVTPARRIAGRSVTTLEGLDPIVRDELANAFCAAGGSQCGFCTPGIVMRAAARPDSNPDRLLAAHLCRCTGWQTIRTALILARTSVTEPELSTSMVRSSRGDLGNAARRAQLEGGVAQRVDASIALGAGGFADDTAPRDALVAVPLPPSSDAEFMEAASRRWVVADSLSAARERAGKVQGRRTTVDAQPPLVSPDPWTGEGVRLATSWVEPAYLEPDASWCAPGVEPVSPLANGGAFGGKEASIVANAARELADQLGDTVRVVFSREDVVRLGPKRPPVAAAARRIGERIEIVGRVVGDTIAFSDPIAWPYCIEEHGQWGPATVAGPPTSDRLRAVGLAERALLIEALLEDRHELTADERAARVVLDSCVRGASGATAGARVVLDDRGQLEQVEIRIAAGDPLDEVVLGSYAVGAAHMALGWVLAEGLAVDETTGVPLDLTIRSFGILRAKDMPPIEVEIVDDPGPPLGRASDAVFAAVAAATWNAVTVADGERPSSFPARSARAAASLRR